MLYSVGQPFRCSNCQSSLVFKTTVSNCLICTQCQGINYRLALPEKTAPTAQKVKEDMSIIRIGTIGALSGIAFEVIGRFQYFFQDSYRNHWHLIFQNGKTGWLGDWAGAFSFFREANARNTDVFRNALPGKKIELQGEMYELEMLDEHRLTFAEGEVQDTLLNEKNFITLYLHQASGAMGLVNIFLPPKGTGKLVNGHGLESFTGQYLELNELNLTNTRNYDDWR